jgi:WD40 repeat protein
VSSVAYAPNGRTVASGDAQGILRCWDTTTHQQRFTRKAHARMIRGIVYAPDSKTVITVDGVYQSPGEVKLWEVASGTELARLGGHQDGINCVAVDADGTRLATGSIDGVVKLWDLANRRPLADLATFPVAVHSLAFAPNSKLLAIGLISGPGVRVWDPVRREEQGVFKPGRSGLSFLSFAFGDRSLVASYNTGQLTEWERASGKIAKSWELLGMVQGAAIAPDGRHLATLNSNGTVYVLRLGSDRLRSR